MATNNDMKKVDLVERFNALRKQESVQYKCLDYLSFNQTMQGKEMQTKSHLHTLSSSFSSSSSVTSSTYGGINEVWREKICEWTFQVIDHFEFDREVASVSLNYLDRYLSTTRPVSRKVFQLAAMTSLFLAIKIYEPTTLRMSSFIDLSRGYFQTEHIAYMEKIILDALSWYIHPPTSLCLVRHYMLLLQESGCSAAVAHETKEVARFLTELSACDYFFVTRKPSSIGLAALLTAFDSMDEINLPSQVRQHFLHRVQVVAGVDPYSTEVRECKARLCETYYHDASYQQQLMEASGRTRDEGRFSPNCIAAVDSVRESNKKHCDR